MQAELQGWDVAPGQEDCTDVQGAPQLTSKIGNEEKLGRWLSTVCPVSVAIRLATWRPWPCDRDLSDTPTIGRRARLPPELRKRPEVQLTSKTWLVNCGWVLAANIAADLAAWCRLLGLYDCEDLKDAEPDTLRYRLLSLPARLVRHARARVLKISRTWPWKEAFLACWERLCALPAPA
jgi:hypothetical protein